MIVIALAPAPVRGIQKLQAATPTLGTAAKIGRLSFAASTSAQLSSALKPVVTGHRPPCGTCSCSTVTEDGEVGQGRQTLPGRRSGQRRIVRPRNQLPARQMLTRGTIRPALP